MTWWRPVARFRPWDELFAMDAGVWRRIARLGLPVAGVRIVEGASYQLLKVVMGAFGASALAAQHIVSSIAGLSTTLVIAIAHAGIVRVSQEMGARRRRAMLRAGWVAIVVATTLAAAVALAMLAAPLDAASIFIDIDDPANGDARALIVPLTLIAAPLIVFEAVHIASTRALRGRLDTWVPMWISAGGAWLIAVPLGLALAFPAQAGPAGCGGAWARAMRSPPSSWRGAGARGRCRPVWRTKAPGNRLSAPTARAARDPP